MHQDYYKTATNGLNTVSQREIICRGKNILKQQTLMQGH
jgi:hypothetical protein